MEGHGTAISEEGEQNVKAISVVLIMSLTLVVVFWTHNLGCYVASHPSLNPYQLHSENRIRRLITEPLRHAGVVSVVKYELINTGDRISYSPVINFSSEYLEKNL